MQTPPAIVPEWYLLPFYAVLRSIPNKLLGVMAMFLAILVLLLIPFIDLSRSRGIQFRPLSKITFFYFIINFILLMQLGAKHVEYPYIELGQISTVIYFGYFLIFVPQISFFENSLIEYVTIKRDIGYLLTNAKSKNYLNSSIYEYLIFFIYFFIGITHKDKSLKYPIIEYLKSIISYFMVISIAHRLNSWYNDRTDAPRPWGIYFQDSATPQMEGLVELHDNILFYLLIIFFGVSWTLASIIIKFNYRNSPVSQKYVSHGTLIELIWTITPALILMLIAFPSFKLLYLMDEVSDPSMAILAEGHQWYWSYQYPDFLNDDDEFIEFDSYLIPESDLEQGALRMLEVDNRVIIPELTHVRFVVTGADVIHSFACPALGIKCDAYPGRLNQMSLYINREGTFYGQCSELCGILHSSMPIVIESVSIEKFVSWIEGQ